VVTHGVLFGMFCHKHILKFIIKCKDLHFIKILHDFWIAHSIFVVL